MSYFFKPRWNTVDVANIASFYPVYESHGFWFALMIFGLTEGVSLVGQIYYSGRTL